MIGVKMELTGDLTAGIDALQKEVETQVLFSGAAAMARVFYDEARVQAEKHKKTGLLQSAIYRVHAKDLSTPERVVYLISWNHTKAPHGHLIEFGTSKSPAYPFIRPAWSFAHAAIDAGKARMAQRLSEFGGKVGSVAP